MSCVAERKLDRRHKRLQRLCQRRGSSLLLGTPLELRFDDLQKAIDQRKMDGVCPLDPNDTMEIIDATDYASDFGLDGEVPLTAAHTTYNKIPIMLVRNAP